MNVTILGGGAWGSTLAELCQRQQHQVKVWTRSDDLARALAGADLIIVALSMKGVPEVADKVRTIGLPPHTILLSGTKGLELTTGRTPSQIWQTCLPTTPIVVLSGPNLATEIRQGLPAASVVASQDITVAQTVQKALSSRNFRLYTNPDPLGVELGGTLKNVIAIAVGVCDGLKLGANAKAALITRALPEIIRIGVDYGAKPETFWGLSGLGDLLATCNSALSRNYRVGLGLAHGQQLGDILSHLEGTAEGIYTAQVIAQKSHIYAPICKTVHRLLEAKITPCQAVEELLNRDLRSEFMH
ncbi:MAG: NAD(P)H-dependent glycerol-3-phosphate dehydrogenase [Pseudanabaenaceae cyanobacterium SKYGB_i_bin29]|nr:NAD(P)H-dependent glycerol-3-phosphate dehydrogenase [Pseudanabaenaceae cyanobacterium SKYG29]MDW8421143.1 NAD(P)H-dependent glycerol-3-phosphate dehydrogenase [Pseudanabaenaceae cyanobacterium SKYGB_i_bin29]